MSEAQAMEVVPTTEDAGRAVAPAMTPVDLLRIAVEKDADLDKLEKLMALQERWEANEARKAYVAALNAFKAAPPKIGKNKHVRYGQTEYDHATLDHVCDVVGAALSEHGLSHRWETDQSDDARITVTCVLTHVLGHSERNSLRAMPDDSGGKNMIQAVGSTTSYLQRYTLLGAVGLAPSDAIQDDDGRGGGGNGGGAGKITDDHAKDLDAMITEVGADKAAFLKYLNVETLDELPAAHYDGAVKALEAKRKQGTE